MTQLNRSSLLKITKRNNILRVEDAVINLDNVLSIKKFDKTRDETGKYTIGVAGVTRTDDKKSWQFIYVTDDKERRDFVFEQISSIL